MRNRATAGLSILLVVLGLAVIARTLAAGVGGGLGLLLGIIGMIAYGLVAGVQPDMRNAYRHFAIPLAIAIGSIAFLGALVLEFRARRASTSIPDR